MRQGDRDRYTERDVHGREMEKDRDVVREDRELDRHSETESKRVGQSECDCQRRPSCLNRRVERHSSELRGLKRAPVKSLFIFAASV